VLEPDPQRATALLALLVDADPNVAAAAAIALGRQGDRRALEPLLQVFRSRAGAAAFHVRHSALAAAIDVAVAAKESDADLARAIEEGAGDPSLLVRGEAMRGRVLLDELARGSEGLMATFGVAQRAASVHERVAAIRALGAAPPLTASAACELLVELASGGDPYPMSEAFSALAAIAARPAGDAAAPSRRLLHEAALDGLRANDLAVVGGALELLKVVGAKDDLALVSDAFSRLGGLDDAEARTDAVHVAAALAGKDAIDLLRAARSDLSPAVVAAAKEEWKKLGLPDDPPRARALERRPTSDDDAGGMASSIALDPDVDFLSRAPNPKVALHFAKGDVVIELLREEAPRHVKMLLERVRAGRLNGLPIHRVVTGFVVQGFDPRGDGWGSGGVFLRDEIGREPYLRGGVGMPNAGPDSAGCQLFFTLVPTPHLDGRYTLFGRVVGGMEVVDALDLGDVCSKAEVIR
jgi:cyclophilin family peptidyl-prolyl cis-trans isomerase